MEKFDKNRIKDFLRGKMSEQQAGEFEAEVNKDDQLLEETLISSLELQAEEEQISRLIKHSVRQTLAEEETAKSGSAPKTARLRILRPALAIAASLALLITAGWYLFSGPSAERLADRQFALYDDLLTSELEAVGFANVEEERLSELLRTGIATYNSEDLAGARGAFEEYRRQTGPQDFFRPYADFYLAQIYWQDGAYEPAIELLTPLAGDDRISFQAAARWYLALSQVKAGDQNQARANLEALADDPVFGEKARRLRSALK